MNKGWDSTRNSGKLGSAKAGDEQKMGFHQEFGENGIKAGIPSGAQENWNEQRQGMNKSWK